SAALVWTQRMGRVLDSRCPPSILWWSVLATLALGVIALRRYDAAVAFSLTLACWAILQARPILAGVALGVAVASKGIPILIVPIAAVYLWKQQRRILIPAALSAAATCLLVCLPGLVAGAGLLDAIRFHATRPIQIESTWAALLQLAGSPSLRGVDSF